MQPFDPVLRFVRRERALLAALLTTALVVLLVALPMSSARLPEASFSTASFFTFHLTPREEAADLGGLAPVPSTAVVRPWAEPNPAKPVNYIIISSQRTGSTLLCALITLSEDGFCAGETLLQQAYVRDYGFPDVSEDVMFNNWT